MKNPSEGLAQKLRRTLRKPPSKHEKRLSDSHLLINRLAAFNFRPPVILEFPGERLARASDFFR